MPGVTLAHTATSSGVPTATTTSKRSVKEHKAALNNIRTATSSYDVPTTTTASKRPVREHRADMTASISSDSGDNRPTVNVPVNIHHMSRVQSRHPVGVFDLGDRFITPSSRPSSSKAAFRGGGKRNDFQTRLPKRPNTAIGYRSHNIESKQRQQMSYRQMPSSFARKKSAINPAINVNDSNYGQDTPKTNVTRACFTKYDRNKETHDDLRKDSDTKQPLSNKHDKGYVKIKLPRELISIPHHGESKQLNSSTKGPDLTSAKYLSTRSNSYTNGSLPESQDPQTAAKNYLHDNNTRQLLSNTPKTDYYTHGRILLHRAANNINTQIPFVNDKASVYQNSTDDQKDNNNERIRPLSRHDIQQQIQQEKLNLVGNLRSRLKGRLKSRRNAGIATDAVFQKQMESGFWTAEVLYHHWADDLLGMRKKWKDETYSYSESQESDKGVVEEMEKINTPARSRGRRNAFSNERESQSGPLSFANLRSFMNLEDDEEDVADDDISDEDLAVATSVADSFHSSGRSTEIITNGRIGKYDQPVTNKPIRTQMQAVEEETKKERRVRKSHIPSRLQAIARKAPFDRTPDEILRIYSTMKNMKSFERFSHRMRMEISKATRYSCCEKGRVILRQGHIGHNFYFIYSGSVFVQVDVEDEKTGVLTPGTTLVMEKGACFGELALLGPGGRRQASIICRETTELFEIEKETFLDVCPDIFESELAEKVDAVLKHDFFQQWPKDKLERLCFESRIEEITHGRIIDPNTANTDNLYFVLKGKVTILKSFDPTESHACADLDNNLTRGHRLPHTTRDNTCFMKIAELTEGEHTELTALRTGDLSEDPGVILVSNGVRLMRMSKKKLERFAPRGLVERFRRQYKPTLQVPSKDDLLFKYHSDVKWQNFKSKISTTLHKEVKGLPLVNIKPSDKGTYRLIH